MSLPRATKVVAEGSATEVIRLDYDARMLRRRKLITETGNEVLVDLDRTVSLDHGDLLSVEDGWLIAIEAADEPLLEVRGDLPRLAWHIGNRHTPCQINDDHLLIRQDHVLAAMLEQLGAGLRPVLAPFRPEGGAYGHGRTLGHSHD